RQTFFAELDGGTETNTASGTGADFQFKAVSDVEKYFTPTNGALLLKMAGAPEYGECKSAALSGSQINITAFPVGSWMCYKTSEGRYGRFTLDSYSDVSGSNAMNLDMRTWTSP
ncbi:MAG: hypothetical protein MUO35_12255, partial [Anaerolineales bacterium]|nr:hypothetical protein [Anaerolineales bacterium]